MTTIRRIRIVDSHTAGEPTRVVLEGGPDLGSGPLVERIARFQEQHDRFRHAIINEPRGSDVLVGALLVMPVDKTCTAGVIFFNNVGYLGMCGHGTIGVISTLAYLGRIHTGVHRLETSAGVGGGPQKPQRDGTVAVTNVPSYRIAKDVECQVPGIGAIRGDVAWGGNAFYLVGDHGQELSVHNVRKLTDFACHLRREINARGYPQVDHIELFGPPVSSNAHSRNFVLCPGGAYDRSPCGTGTSAKLACLAADGLLKEAEKWVQESIIGSTFRASYQRCSGGILPTIYGVAYVTGEATLLLDERDPFCWGIRA
jgi:4-hydroxyproline epimerase